MFNYLTPLWLKKIAHVWIKSSLVYISLSFRFGRLLFVIGRPFREVTDYEKSCDSIYPIYSWFLLDICPFVYISSAFPSGPATAFTWVSYPSVHSFQISYWIWGWLRKNSLVHHNSIDLIDSVAGSTVAIGIVIIYS